MNQWLSSQTTPLWLCLQQKGRILIQLPPSQLHGHPWMPVTLPFVSGCVTTASLSFTALLQEVGMTATATWGEEETGLMFKGVPCSVKEHREVGGPPSILSRGPPVTTSSMDLFPE